MSVYYNLSAFFLIGAFCGEHFNVMAIRKSKNLSGRAQRRYSSQLMDGYERAPSRAMLHAVGFKGNDFKKPQIGIASTWSQVTPCNMHIDKLALRARRGVERAGGKALIFNTNHHIRWHFHGHARHEVFSGFA